jgi:hypothetical protein
VVGFQNPLGSAGDIGGAKMNPPQMSKGNAMNVQREYLEWDRTYTYFQMGFTSKII